MLQRRPSPWGNTLFPEEPEEPPADLRPREDKLHGLEEPREPVLSPEVYFPVVAVKSPVTTEGPKRWG